MNHAILLSNARAAIADKIQSGQPVKIAWAVHELISQQGNINGDGEDFYMLCAKEHVYRMLKKAVDRCDWSQLESGYDCLQQAYTFEHDDERQLVPVHLISDEELLQRADEYRRQSEGLLNHSREIELYVANRRQSIAKETAQ